MAKLLTDVPGYAGSKAPSARERCGPSFCCKLEFRTDSLSRGIHRNLFVRALLKSHTSSWVAPKSASAYLWMQPSIKATLSGRNKS